MEYAGILDDKDAQDPFLALFPSNRFWSYSVNIVPVGVPQELFPAVIPGRDDEPRDRHLEAGRMVPLTTGLGLRELLRVLARASSVSWYVRSSLSSRGDGARGGNHCAGWSAGMSS